MSRIGKKPIPLPAGVTVECKDGNRVVVEGPKGRLEQAFDPAMEIEVTGDPPQIRVRRPSDRKRHRELHGLTRALLQNMVTGVTEGYAKELEVQGLGYTCSVSGNKLTLNVGFCHPVEVTAPEGISVESPMRGRIRVSGIDKQKVGQFAAEIRRIRPPEPYKGKGIRYVGEVVRRKQGKAFGK